MYMFKLFKRKEKPIPQPPQLSPLEMINNVKDLMDAVLPLLEKVGQINNHWNHMNKRSQTNPRLTSATRKKIKQNKTLNQKSSKLVAANKRNKLRHNVSQKKEQKNNFHPLEMLSLLNNPLIRSLLTPPDDKK